MPNPDAMFRLSPVMARYLLERTGEPQLAAIEMFEAGDVESLQVLEQELAKDNPWMTKNVRLALEQSAIYGLNTGHPGMQYNYSDGIADNIDDVHHHGNSHQRLRQSHAAIQTCTPVIKRQKRK